MQVTKSSSNIHAYPFFIFNTHWYPQFRFGNDIPYKLMQRKRVEQKNTIESESETILHGKFMEYFSQPLAWPYLFSMVCNAKRLKEIINIWYYTCAIHNALIVSFHFRIHADQLNRLFAKNDFLTNTQTQIHKALHLRVTAPHIYYVQP